MNTKQVIVLRKDLNMRKGKMVAQGAHASMKVFLDKSIIAESEDGDIFLETLLTEAMKEWVAGRFTKVCVSVDSELELLAIHKEANEAGLPCSLIQDAGLTEFGFVPTYTAVAVGPAEVEDVDRITGGLKLL